MKSDEIYKDVLQVVASVTGISETGIIHSNKEECANARYLLVRYLAKIFSDTEIASLTNRTKQAVGSMRRNAKKQRVWIVVDKICNFITYWFTVTYNVYQRAVLNLVSFWYHYITFVIISLNFISYIFLLYF